MAEEGSGARAAARGQQAGQRADELRARRERLQRGEAVTEQDVDEARDAVGRAQVRDVDSSRSAAEGERAAAAAHRKVADVLEQAGDQDRATWHRERARDDDAGAVVDDRTAVEEAER